MTNIQRRTLTATALLTLAVLFVALTMLSNTLFKGARLDLTENQLFTLSSGTKNLLANLREPINLYFFFSEKTAQDIPLLTNYAKRVNELLQEYALNAAGKLKLQVIDPLPFSEDEDRAAQFGLQGIPKGTTGDNIYFGLAGTNTVGGLEVISFFQPDKEAFLEYDLSKLIYTLNDPKKPVIGLLSTLSMKRDFDPMTRQMREPWIITSQIEQLFEVRELSPTVNTIDTDIDILMLVHPKDLSDQTLFAIDQFVLKGGKAIVFVDPYAEADITQDPMNPAAALAANRSSAIPKLFQAWGVKFEPNLVVGDRGYALDVSKSPGQPLVRHLAILGFDRSGFNQQDVVTAQLNTLNVATCGYFKAAEGSPTTLVPLITSSTQAMPIAADRFQLLTNPASLNQGFQPTGERYVIAARLQGKVKSAFPAGPPGEKKPDTSMPSLLAESAQAINVILVADTDVLTDRLWIRVQNFFGQRIATPWANNGDFVTNALDNLTGSTDLISIRGRATAVRPFTKVEALKREADARFRATEQQLQEQLGETERKLNELQSGRHKDENPLILTPEQNAELERFQEQKLAIRKQLRQVQHNLDQDIEQLGTRLKLINIGLVPLLISLLALTLATLRSRRRIRRIP
jgi:ABC-type uncharacterized transport system involved in gliding motility auxiliary subunit